MDKFPLARQGWPYLASAVFLAAVATALGVWWLAAPLWAVALLVGNFFRDPPRQSQADERAVISPADGKVVVVSETTHPELPGGPVRLVSVFMNIFDVHVNRAPWPGGCARWSTAPAASCPPTGPRPPRPTNAWTWCWTGARPPSWSPRWPGWWPAESNVGPLRGCIRARSAVRYD